MNSLVPRSGIIRSTSAGMDRAGLPEKVRKKEISPETGDQWFGNVKGNPLPQLKQLMRLLLIFFALCLESL